MTKLVVILKIFFTVVLAFFMQGFLPWWSAALSAFLIAFILYSKPGSSFLAGFLGIFLLWHTWAIVSNSVNDGILASRVAAIFQLPNTTLLMIVTAIVGGLVGGLGGITGSYFRNWILPREQ
jgi:hypothetical protein